MNQVGFSYQIEKDGDSDRLLLHGAITEDARVALREIKDICGKNVRINFAGVTYINSCGIRDWSYMLRELLNGRSVAYEQVPEDVIRTINMVYGFHQGVPILSLSRIYECTECQSETLVHFENGKDYRVGETPRLASAKCSSCGSEALPAEADEEFFMFLTEVA